MEAEKAKLRKMLVCKEMLVSRRTNTAGLLRMQISPLCKGHIKDMVISAFPVWIQGRGFKPLCLQIDQKKVISLNAQMEKKEIMILASEA